MNHKQFWKHFIIALILFLLGYFTFNSKLFGNPLQATAGADVIVDR